MQTIIVVIIVTVALYLTGRRLFRSLSGTQSGCSGGCGCCSGKNRCKD